MDKRIIFKVKRDGSIEMQALGFQGSACMNATAAFEKMFSEVDVKHTSEYYMEEEVGEQILVKQGSGVNGESE